MNEFIGGYGNVSTQIPRKTDNIKTYTSILDTARDDANEVTGKTTEELF
ncbi:MAG: hypothetical protein IPP06_05355 [Saprospiraceae bacterium]|nr:hypothetical protein [Candidatus Vicinibacter affinis]MBK9960763.1 hypothetical protein [Candidatus Vicinibacter affinis]